VAWGVPVQPHDAPSLRSGASGNSDSHTGAGAEVAVVTMTRRCIPVQRGRSGRNVAAEGTDIRTARRTASQTACQRSRPMANGA
jgi:hypothetical protein